MGEWKEVEIGSLCLSVSSGGTPKSTNESYYGGDIPWLNTKEINFNRIYDTEKHITSLGFKNSAAKWVKKNSVIVAMYGATAAKVAMNMVDLTTNQACCNLTIDETKANPKFVYYSLLNNFKVLYNLSSGAAQQNLNSQIIKEFLIYVPSLITQNKIVTILSTIDDRIEINKKINHNLEKLMQLLYKKYFQENNPFYNDSIHNDMTWNMIKLENLVIRNREKIKEYNMWKNELLIDLSNMPRFSISINHFDKGSKLKSNIFKLNKFDLLFGSIRPYFGKVCFSPIDGVVAGTIHSFKPIDRIYYAFLLSLISSKNFIKYTISMSKGTKMPIINWDDFINYEFAIPKDKDYIEEFNRKVMPLIKKIYYNIHEIYILNSIKDILLPKLLTGEIDVSEIKADI